MRRLFAIASVATAVTGAPGVAYAQTAELVGRESVDIAAGVATLLAALWLLVVALRLAKVSEGSTYAENIRYVVLGSLCLAGSVLASWSTHFMPDAFSSAQAQLGANLFIVVAIIFLAIYFTRVLRVLSKFMRAARAISAPVEAPSGDGLADVVADEPVTDSDASGPGPEAGDGESDG
jgi:hypothetical protein